jgi:hypothetical protein
MSMRPSGWRGPLIYAAVVLTGVTIVALAMSAVHISVGEPRAQAFIFAAMWMPAFARFASTATVDRGWQSPFPVRRWGRPAWIVVVLPLASVTAIYAGAYAIASLAGVPRSAPAWPRGRVVVNVLVNLPLLRDVVSPSIDSAGGLSRRRAPRDDSLATPWANVARFRPIGCV